MTRGFFLRRYSFRALEEVKVKIGRVETTRVGTNLLPCPGWTGSPLNRQFSCGDGGYWSFPVALKTPSALEKQVLIRIFFLVRIQTCKEKKGQVRRKKTHGAHPKKRNQKPWSSKEKRSANRLISFFKKEPLVGFPTICPSQVIKIKHIWNIPKNSKFICSLMSNANSFQKDGNHIAHLWQALGPSLETPQSLIFPDFSHDFLL